MVPRELREKDEIEKYRMERPKIQQQFSDLKVGHCSHGNRFKSPVLSLSSSTFKSAKDTNFHLLMDNDTESFILFILSPFLSLALV